MKIIFAVALAVMLFAVPVMAMDTYVELGYDAVDRGNSDMERANSLDVGAGVSGDYGAIKPYARFSAGLDESGFSVVDRSLKVGSKYSINEHVTLDVGYETQKYPTGDRVNTLGMKARYNF